MVYITCTSILICALPCLINLHSTLAQKNPEVNLYFRTDIADLEFFNDTHALLTNSNPVFTLNCSAGYPIDWDFNFHQNDNGASFKKIAKVERFIQLESFDDTSLYLYNIALEIEYTGKVHIFTDFTCHSVENLQLETQVTTRPEGNQNELVILSIESNREKHRRKHGPNRSEKVVDECKIYATVTDVDVIERSACWSCVLSDNTVKFLDFITCHSPIECKTLFAQQNHGKSCLKVLDPETLTDDYDACSPIPGGRFSPYTLLCKNFGPALAQLCFYGIQRNASVAPKIFFGWDEVIKEEMVYLHPLKEERVYYNQTIKLVCEVSYFYCAYGTVFSVMWKDSKIREMFRGERDTEIQNGDKGSYIVSTNIQLLETGEVVCTCHAPVWNSSEWINSSAAFSVANGVFPSVLYVGIGDDAKAFKVEDRNRSIVCRFEGDPIKDIQWDFPKPELMGFYRVTNNMKAKESTLTIPTVSSNYAGQYSCTVASFMGESKKSYVLRIEQSSSWAYIWIIVTILLCVVVAAGVFIVRLLRTLKIQREKLRFLTEAEIQEFLQGNPESPRETVFFNQASSFQALSYNTAFEISMDKLNIDYQKLLGKGEFGKVYRGKITDEISSPNYINIVLDSNNCGGLDVAVKTVDSDLDVEHFKALLSEIKVMVHIGSHPNVVGLVAACTENIRQRQVYVAIELCEGGSLFNYLRQGRQEFDNFVEYGKFKLQPSNENPGKKFSTLDLFKWTKDVGTGLNYIQEKKVIHGDLATRNVLLSTDGLAKIGDFGLARQLVDSANYVKKSQVGLPWRHMAPESLKDLVFSSKSDVWALGVTLWEIFTLSEVPYGGTNYGLQFIMQLEDGILLHKPIYATNDIYEFMLRCWAINPQDRPEPYEVLPLCDAAFQALLTDKIVIPEKGEADGHDNKSQ